MTSGWLLDTNVVSELLKGIRASRNVQAWVDGIDRDELYLSAITLGEIAKGIALAEDRGRDMRRQRQFLNRDLPEMFGSRILSFDSGAAIIWGRMLRRFSGNRAEERLFVIDAQIAATAEASGPPIVLPKRQGF